MVLRDEAELVPGLMGSMVLGGAGWYWGELHIVQSRQSIRSDVSPAASPHFQITTHSSALVGLGIMVVVVVVVVVGRRRAAGGLQARRIMHAKQP